MDFENIVHLCTGVLDSEQMLDMPQENKLAIVRWCVLGVWTAHVGRMLFEVFDEANEAIYIYIYMYTCIIVI